MLYLFFQMGFILALAALLFFGLGYWYAYGVLGRKRNSSVAAKERKFHQSSQEDDSKGEKEES
ncbi:MAG: hypothetical protein MK172_01655 [Verrucomicrobiales bacterium]|nr:hypothetical protein [Verrucomicrobiales bacterium]